MKNFFLFILIIGFVSSCNKNDEISSSSDLEGRWKLSEIFADPGNGSGTFQSVTSNKTLVFDNNGNVTSNGIICDMSSGTNLSSSGTYSLINGKINSSLCPNINIQFELNNNTLLLIYPCIEPCKSKYIRVP
jgi:hypothetical protein